MSHFCDGHISTTMRSLEVLKVAACSYGLDLLIKHHLVGQHVYHGNSNSLINVKIPSSPHCRQYESPNHSHTDYTPRFGENVM